MHSLVVISSYPPKGTTHHKSVIGGAAYTKNTLISLKKEAEKRHEYMHVTVLAQELEDSQNSYADEGIFVKRIWKRNSLLTFGKLYKEILIHHKDTKDVLIELELNIFGKSGIFLGLLLNFIFSLKLLNKKVTLVIHEVIFDMGKFGPHINLKEKSLKTTILNSGLNGFYNSICRVVDKVIVFEESLKIKLSEMTGQRKKITVIPIAVEEVKNQPSKEEARKKLGLPADEFMVMTFGFLAWYKGTDWLTEVWDKDIAQNKNIQLIIAGGPNPNRIDLPYYKKYLADLEETSRKKDILLTGFVPEEKMGLYFAACDVVIFPYRTLMQSSAVLSMAFSYEKPILLSENMAPMLLNKDVQDELLASGLKEEDILFPLDNSLIDRLEYLEKIPLRLAQIKSFSQKMKSKRSWNLIGGKYYEAIF